MDVRLKYLKVEKSRHGKTFIYVRLPGHKKIRLPVDSVDDLAFGPAYATALTGKVPAPAKPIATAKVDKPAQGSLREVCTAYAAFLAKDQTLEERTKYIRRRHMDEVCLSPVKPGDKRLIGDMPAALITTAIAQKILDRKSSTPAAANDRRKVLNRMFRWAVKRGYVTMNPFQQTDVIKTTSDGHETWTVAHVERFVKTHPLGTKAYLAMALLLYTGQRRSDVVKLGRQHIGKDGKLHFTQSKNEKRQHKRMAIPILPVLQEALDLVPPGQLTFLQTQFGKPHTAAGFGGWFRRMCDKACCPDVSAHGLRKTLQAIGADMGLTDRELMAIAGHETAAETSRYTKGRDRELLAESGMAKLANLRIGQP